ncbi:MAG: hypothetical protein OXT67_12960 [Zetaproteobacteria bacterium]|nr:hypothetical protein [Zetaproteobacteria bacterium]
MLSCTYLLGCVSYSCLYAKELSAFEAQFQSYRQYQDFVLGVVNRASRHVMLAVFALHDGEITSALHHAQVRGIPVFVALHPQDIDDYLSQYPYLRMHRIRVAKKPWPFSRISRGALMVDGAIYLLSADFDRDQRVPLVVRRLRGSTAQRKQVLEFFMALLPQSFLAKQRRRNAIHKESSLDRKGSSQKKERPGPSLREAQDFQPYRYSGNRAVRPQNIPGVLPGTPKYQKLGRPAMNDG